MSGLAAALDVVGARWALLIVERLLDGPQRYGDLQRDLGVPTNILTTRLRELEAAGVLSRLPLRHNTRAYALTDRGQALREAVDALTRWGGEEFLVGLYGMSAEAATRRLTTVLDALMTTDFTLGDDRQVRITFSAGVAASPTNGDNLQDLYRAADAALYQAKRAGRSRVLAASIEPD